MPLPPAVVGALAPGPCWGPLTVVDLEACVDRAVAAESSTSATCQLSKVVSVLDSPADMGSSFRRGNQVGGSCDYAGVQAAFERLCSKDANPWAFSSSEKVRSAALGALVRAAASRAASRPPADAASQESWELSSSSSSSSSSSPSASSASLPGVPTVEEKEHVPGGGSCWAATMLAALLPLMADALPRDANGICVIPHRHRMEQQAASEDALYFTGCGRIAFRTNKVCDNCQTRIMDRVFYHCSENCDIDFCEDCHRKLQQVFEAFFAHANEEDKDRRYQRLVWVITVTEHMAVHVLHLSSADRLRLAHEFAFEWPTSMFHQFIRVVIDVVNAKVVHVQDVKDIQSDGKFWYTVGLLQFLYSANLLPCSTRRLDEQGSRGPKIEYDSFILEGINKCEPISEWQRWREHPSAKVPDMLAIDGFGLTADFCSFLTHNNLVPVSFRRVCLLCDIWEQIQLDTGRVVPLQIEVRREPAALLEDVLRSFDGLSDGQLRRPLRVTFQGEEGCGPGVTKEFFQVVLRSFLDGGGLVGLFKYYEHQRTYWFNEGNCHHGAFRACGVLLGQAVLNTVLVPNIFPRALYECLLQDLGSPCARELGLEDLAAVSKETALSLQKVLDYMEDDIGTVFGDIEWSATGRVPPGSQLNQANKVQLVQSYVAWFFNERIAAQFAPLSEGFRAILGCSALLQSMVDAVQLEKIVCGGSVPVDVAAIRRGATHEGWTTAEESEYLPAFWEVVESLNEAEKVQFVVFTTASDRVPLRGWQDLQLTVHKNGVGDDRLPCAHTCFSQMLLPKYSSRETLKVNLQLAIANSEGFGLR